MSAVMRLDVGFCFSAPLPPKNLKPVSMFREAMDRLRAYADLLTERQKVQNLVSRNSLDYLWDRHMLDSIQLAELLPQDAVSLTDIGSGAGFLDSCWQSTLVCQRSSLMIAWAKMRVSPRRYRCYGGPCPGCK